MADLQTSLLSQDPMAKTSKLAELAHRSFCHGGRQVARIVHSLVLCLAKSSPIFSACHGRHARPSGMVNHAGTPAGFVLDRPG